MNTPIDLSIFSKNKDILTEEAEQQIMDKVAKLLAKENIAIIYGNFRTAAFNIKDRIMYLPRWLDVSKPMKFRLRLHEVGHAIYTQMSDFHGEMIKQYGRVMATYINIVEDDRIDRFTLRDFPGARPYVIAANKEFLEMGFFGIKNVSEARNMMFIDRLNVNSKLGSEMFPMQFANETEADFYRRFKTTSTLKEVIDLAVEIFKYAKYEEPKTQFEEPQTDDYGDSEEFGDSSEEQNEPFEDFPGGSAAEEEESESSEESGESEEVSEPTAGDSGEESDTGEESEDGKSASGKSEDGDESSEKEELENKEKKGSEEVSNGNEAGSSVLDPKPDSELSSKTDDAYRENEEKLSDDNYDEKAGTPNYYRLKQAFTNETKIDFGTNDFLKIMKSRIK